MREQEHGWEPLGSAMVVEAQAALGADGRIVGWRTRSGATPTATRPTAAGGLLAGREVEPPFTPPPPRPIPMPEGGGDRNADPIYALPNARGDLPLRRRRCRCGCRRCAALGAHMNVFAIESFMDELRARPAPIRSPSASRHLEDARAREVVQPRPPSASAGRGAAGRRAARHAASPSPATRTSPPTAPSRWRCEVDRDTGAIHVPRAVAAVDSGEAVNPDGIRNQIEGGIVQSLSWTLVEAVGFDATHRTSFDWSAYPILRFPAVPGRSRCT